MKSGAEEAPLRVQTRERAMDALEEVRAHVDALRKGVSWDRVGVLCDEGPEAMVTVLLTGERVVAAMRFALPADESARALGVCSQGTDAEMELRCWQGHTLTCEQTRSLTALTEVWGETAGQRAVQTLEDWREYYRNAGREARKKGRGATVSVGTRNQVLLEAHGRCMFEGCGADLTTDPETGEGGNFATLAHNVAASEGGARGVLYLSGRLADDPGNILLLCDRHHRMVDTVAKADYPAAKLSAMRRRFCEDASVLLDGLALEGIPGYCVVWPVHGQAVAVPSSVEVARALRPVGARLAGHLQTVTANDETLRVVSPEAGWGAMASAVDRAADRILMQAHGEGYRAALFAMGPMPSLIGLGAKLGNKGAITPMLRFRDSGSWYWPAKEPQG